MSPIGHITPAEVWKSLQEGRGRLIDVREPGEFGGVRAPGSLNFPLSSLEERVNDVPAGDPIYVLCSVGARAVAGVKILDDSGRKAEVVSGGLTEWQRIGLPLETGRRRVWPMERQVRLGAGSLILLGMGLGWGIHPGFFGIAVFVGAGLVFSAITGFCGMVLVLARCPWNR